MEELLNQKDILDYLRERQYPILLGEELFPEVKRESLEFDMIAEGSRTPVIASVHGFDTEAEIGSREAQEMTLELALIKRKMQMKEKDILALQYPRNEAEKKYLTKRVYNDFDALNLGIRARIELMRMELLANGTVSLNENGLSAVIDYGVPETHKVANVDWDKVDSDPIEDILTWYNLMETKPKRVLTSNTILMKLLKHPKITARLFGNNTTRIATAGELNIYLQSLKLPSIYTYDEGYRKQKGRTYETHRYFPENAFVMMPDNELGETIYGPTPEEIVLTSESDVTAEQIGKILDVIYTETKDPVGTWKKGVATALPSCPYADELFQAKIKIA